MEKVAVLDFGGQYTHLIARRIRQLGVYSEVLPPFCEPSELEGFLGIVYSGGPSSVYSEDAPEFNPALLRVGLPTLGLCYGHQLISLLKKGAVKRGEVHEFGPAKLQMAQPHPLLDGIPQGSTVWMSHGDEVVSLPEGFRVIASTSNCRHAAVANDAERFYGFQFHPEVTHSEHGSRMLRNFLALCGASFSWNVDDFLPDLERRLREQCKGRKAFLLVSGGVDSTVAFALLNRALGPENVLGLHIDTGFMRKDESAEVMDFMKREGFHNLVVKDASGIFLERLEGIHSPETKRKIIGETFLEVKDRELDALALDPQHWILAQGTIYPDTIESGATRNSAVIKTHHNRVQGILDLMAAGLVVEPLADFYKDEVRELGLSLGVPKDLVDRHPFPGPGLAVRLLCRESGEECISSGLEAQVEDLLLAEGVSGQLLPVRSVGVQGDVRTYAHPCLVRGIRDWSRCDLLSTRMTNTVRGVNRVVLELGRRGQEPYLPVAAQCDRPRLDLLRDIDAHCTAFLRQEGFYQSVWQMPVVLLPLETGGGAVLVLRPVDSTEAMTASFSQLPFEALERLWSELEQVGVGALLYDITHKPPGTIEWE